jgi:chaperonin cofactor prefoldin
VKSEARHIDSLKRKVERLEDRVETLTRAVARMQQTVVDLRMAKSHAAQ